MCLRSGHLKVLMKSKKKNLAVETLHIIREKKATYVNESTGDYSNFFKGHTE